MAWGKSKPQASPSLLSHLIPLVLVFALVAGLAFVGYQIYHSAHKVKGDVSERMGKKNVVWTKDGLKVGVKHVESEKEVDATQKYLVNAWHLRSNKAQNDGRKRK